METKGEYIKRMRKSMGMTGEALASALGVNYTTLWRWETGKITRIHLSVVREVERLAANKLAERGG